MSHRDISQDAFDRFDAEMAAASQPGDAFAALQQLAQSVIGAHLFTVMRLTGDAMQGQRIYTNMPDAYPVSGIVTLRENIWYDTAIRRQSPFIANDAAEIAAAFADHDLIASLGCGSALNIPVIEKGRVLATINLLDQPGHFTAERVDLALATLTEPARAALAAEDRLRADAADHDIARSPTR